MLTITQVEELKARISVALNRPFEETVRSPFIALSAALRPINLKLSEEVDSFLRWYSSPRLADFEQTLCNRYKRQ